MDNDNGGGANVAPSTFEYTRDLAKAYGPVLSPDDTVRYASTGLCTEAADVLDIYKKAIGGVMPVDRARVVEELGDVIYALALLTMTEGITMQEINEVLAAKLHEIYPEGYWSPSQYQAYRRRKHQGELR